jgi:hypothetical protein
MAEERRFADVKSMRPVLRAVFGRSRSLLSVERLAHGSKKGAYRLAMDDGGTVLVYAREGRVRRRGRPFRRDVVRSNHARSSAGPAH